LLKNYVQIDAYIPVFALPAICARLVLTFILELGPKDDNNSIGKPGDQLGIPEGFAREEY
jgi:hypothetical protein